MALTLTGIRVQCKNMNRLTANEFLAWNHPLRLDAERMVQQYCDYAQTHLASDNKQQLSNLFLEFLRTHKDGQRQQRQAY